MLHRGIKELRRPGRTVSACTGAFVLADEPAIRCNRSDCRFSHSPADVNAVIRAACYGSGHAALPPASGSASHQPASAMVDAAAAMEAATSADASDCPLFRFRTALEPGIRIDNGRPQPTLETINSDTDDQELISRRVVLHVPFPAGPVSASSLAQLEGSRAALEEAARSRGG